MDAHELAEWWAFTRVEGPIGEQRADHRIAMLTALTHNAHRAKGQRAAKPADYMPWAVREAREPEPPRVVESRLRGIFNAMMGKRGGA